MSDYTILVVDYDPSMIASARATLEKAGYKVETAANGIEGIEAFNRIEPALTLIELMLPKKSGLEVCRELRKTEYGKDAALVITGSRFRSRQYRNDARHTYKADDFVEKPISEDTLLALVEAVIGGRARSAATPVASVVAPAPSTTSDTGQPEPELAAAVVTSTPAPDDSDRSLESEIGDHLDSLLGDG